MGVAPKYLRDAIRLPTSASSLRPLRSLDSRELFVPRTRTTTAIYLDPFPLLALLFGIAFHLHSARASRDVNKDLTPKDQRKDKDLSPRTRTRTRTCAGRAWTRT